MNDKAFKNELFYNMNNHKQKTMYGILGIAMLAIGFYGGISYEKSKVPTSGAGQYMGGNGRQMRMGGARGGGFISGEIISQDQNGITVKVSDGGSKIVFFSASTTIAKSTSGSKDDLTVGTQVVINGKTNADGSITADNVQIRPVGQIRPRTN